MKKFTLIFLAFLTFNISMTSAVRAALIPISIISMKQNIFAGDLSAEDEQTIIDDEIAIVSDSRLEKSKFITILMAITGLHHFYLGNTKTGVLYIVLHVFYGVGFLLSVIDLLHLFLWMKQNGMII